MERWDEERTALERALRELVNAAVPGALVEVGYLRFTAAGSTACQHKLFAHVDRERHGPAVIGRGGRSVEALRHLLKQRASVGGIRESVDLAVVMDRREARDEGISWTR